MIEVSDIISRVRFKVRDTDEIKYSDEDILDNLDDVVDYLNKQYALRNADFLEKAKTYDADAEGGVADFLHDGVRLPYDFVGLVGVYRGRDRYEMSPVATVDEIGYGKFLVMGEKLYTKEKEFTLVYRRRIEGVESVKDTIDLPEIFTKTLINATHLAMTGNPTAFQEVVDRAVSNIVTARKYSNIKPKMPFIV